MLLLQDRALFVHAQEVSPEHRPLRCLAPNIVIDMTLGLRWTPRLCRLLYHCAHRAHRTARTAPRAPLRRLDRAIYWSACAAVRRSIWPAPSTCGLGRVKPRPMCSLPGSAEDCERAAVIYKQGLLGKPAPGKADELQSQASRIRMEEERRPVEDPRVNRHRDI